MDHSMPGFLSVTDSWGLLKLISTESMMPSNHFILCHALLLLPSIFPSIRYPFSILYTTLNLVLNSSFIEVNIINTIQITSGTLDVRKHVAKYLFFSLCDKGRHTRRRLKHILSYFIYQIYQILQARLQQYVNFQMFKLDLERAEEPEIKLPTSARSLKKQENSRKTFTSALLTMPKPLCGSQQTMENSLRDKNTRPPDLPPEIHMQVKKQQLEPDMGK